MYLVTIDEAGDDEVDGGLYPQHMVLGLHLAQRGSHLIDTHKAAYAEGGGEQAGNGLPEGGDAGLRPADAREEQQGQGDEDHEEHDVLAIAHHTRDDHAEEDARQEVGQDERQQRLPLAYGREAEHAGHDEQQVGRQDGVDHKVGHSLACHDAEHAVVVAADGNEVLEAVFLAGRSCGQSYAEYKRLLDDEHQDGRQDERTVAARGVEDGYLIEVEGASAYLFLACCI